MFLVLFNAFLMVFEVTQLIVRSLCFIAEAVFRKIVPPPKKNIGSDIALITGAGHGLGRELANQFANLGAKVVLWDIDKENVCNVADEIVKNGGVAHGYVCDVTDEAMVERLALQVRREVGDVTILVNNAGILHCQTLMNLNNQQIRRTMEVNLLAHFWTIRQFLPRMLEIGRGHIVAIGSVASVIGQVNMTDYCGSKFGVRGMMEALSKELHQAGKNRVIHLTTVCPLTFNTGLAKRPKTRFPKLAPVLETSEVANAAMEGILRNQDFVVVPARVGLILALQEFIWGLMRLMINIFARVHHTIFISTKRQTIGS